MTRFAIVYTHAVGALLDLFIERRDTDGSWVRVLPPHHLRRPLRPDFEVPQDAIAPAGPNTSRLSANLQTRQLVEWDHHHALVSILLEFQAEHPDRSYPRDLGVEIRRLVDIAEKGERSEPGEILVPDGPTWILLSEFLELLCALKPTVEERLYHPREILVPWLIRRLIVVGPDEHRRIADLIHQMTDGGGPYDNNGHVDWMHVDAARREGTLATITIDEAEAMFLRGEYPVPSTVVRSESIRDPANELGDFRTKTIPYLLSLVQSADDVRFIYGISY